MYLLCKADPNIGLMLWCRTFSFQSRIETLIRSGKMKPDSAQELAISTLSALSETLHQPPGGFFCPKQPAKGVYIYGSVGKCLNQ